MEGEGTVDQETRYCEMKDLFGTERDGNGKKIGTPQGASELKAMLDLRSRLDEAYRAGAQDERAAISRRLFHKRGFFVNEI